MCSEERYITCAICLYRYMQIEIKFTCVSCVSQKLLICHLQFDLCISSKVVCLEYNVQISIAKYFIILSVHLLLTNYFKQDKDHGSKWG